MAKAQKAAPVGVMYLVEPGQRDRLQAAAMRVRTARGGAGRIDASEVLRALLDRWIRDGGDPPEELMKGKR